jgi:hypothetical protein
VGGALDESVFIEEVWVWKGHQKSILKRESEDTSRTPPPNNALTELSRGMAFDILIRRQINVSC